MNPQANVQGTVTGDFGRDFLVELADRTQLTCSRKGKKPGMGAY